MPSSQMCKPIFLHASAKQAFRLAHRDCAIRLARPRIRHAPFSKHFKIAIACTHRIIPFLFLRVLTGSTPRVSRYPPYYPRRGIPARLPRCLCRLYMACTPHRRAANPSHGWQWCRRERVPRRISRPLRAPPASYRQAVSRSRYPVRAGRRREHLPRVIRWARPLHTGGHISGRWRGLYVRAPLYQSSPGRP